MALRFAFALPVLALLAGPLLAAPPITSASEPPPYARTFSQLDTNRDGQLTFSEAFENPLISDNFNELDKNADGLLSPDEVRGVIPLR